MIFNREKRIQYLGFDDVKAGIVGVFVLSIVTTIMFTNSFAKDDITRVIFDWSISLMFSSINWIVMRWMMIFLRKKFPHHREVVKRVGIAFVLILVSVFFIDYLGSTLVVGDEYHILRLRVIVLPVLIISLMVYAMYEGVFQYINLKKSIREEAQLKQMMVQAELDALRNQAQPHFFFNTLNTLRDIISENPKEDAMLFVDKLSEVYRFILESGDGNTISINDEISFAKAYLHIQSERFGNNLKVEWETSEASKDKFIVPMSMQTLLENAIKHNVVSKANPLVVKVKILEDRIEISNKIQLKSTRMPSTQLGLKNIGKRYQLISEKSINIQQSDGQFKVILPLLTLADLKHNDEGIDN